MKKGFIWLMLSWLMVVSLVLASCGEAVPGEQEEEEEEEEEEGVFPRSETLYAGVLSGRAGTPDNFNNWVGWKNMDRGMSQLMNEPLWTVEYTPGEIINGLAAAPVEYNEDYTQMTIKLREGVYWSDGVEFTADDVVFTIKLLRDTEGMNYHPQLQGAESVYATDRYTVVIELDPPNSRFNAHFLDRWGACYIMPKHVFEQVEDPILFEYNPPLSLGPYVLHSYDPAGFWTAWVRRDDWDRTPTGMLYGKPVPKYVVFGTYIETTTRVIAQTRHELDMTDLTLEALKVSLDQNPYFRGFQLEYPWSENIHPCLTGLTFNCIKPPFDNSEVRWALALAIDIVSHSATAYDGAVTMGAIHNPLTSLFVKAYYEPMEEWLLDFTLDLGNGETFQPYDLEAPYRLAEYAESRGYAVPEDIMGTFGYGWWKYAPDVAATLLENNGFTRDKDGNWLLPDGTPWKFTITTSTAAASPAYQNAFAAANEWRKFGIDVGVITLESTGPVTAHGQFDVNTDWPAPHGTWGGHIDLFKVLDFWNSDYVEPVLGERTWGHSSRWSDPRIDQVITELKDTDWNDTDRIAQLGIEALKVATEEMPGICTFMYPSVIGWDTYYWTGFPGAENAYCQPHYHWPNFKYMLPFLEPTGR